MYCTMLKLFFFESTPKSYHIFIEGRSLSTRTAPLATSNERNLTQRRLQTKQPQHKEPVLSNKPSHVSTGVKHLRRGTAPKGTSLSTHHPKEINGGTWTDPRSCPPEHEHASSDVHSALMNCHGPLRRRIEAAKDLCTVSSYPMLPTELRRRRRHHRADPRIEAFARRQHPAPSRLWGLRHSSAAPPRRGTTPAGAVAAGPTEPS